MGILRELFESPAAQCQREKQELTAAFNSAVSARNWEEAQRLLNSYRGQNDIDAQTKGFALVDAAERNDVDMIEVLALHKADVNYNNGLTPLICAARYGAIDAAEKLIALKADVDAVTNDGGSALMAAAERGHADTVRMLLKAGADIHFRDRHNRRALELAREGRHYEVTRILRDVYKKKTPVPETAATPVEAMAGNIVELAPKRINL